MNRLLLDLGILILQMWLEVWEDIPLTATAHIIEISHQMVEIHDRSELPDWVIILAEGNPEHMADVIAVARDDMKEEENAEHYDVSEI